jgi:hypothetical protein
MEGPTFQIKEKESGEEMLANTPYKVVKKYNQKYNIHNTTKKDAVEVFGFHLPEIQGMLNALKEKRVTWDEQVFDPEGDKSCPICGRYFSKYVMEFHLETKHTLKEKKMAMKLLNK